MDQQITSFFLDIEGQKFTYIHGPSRGARAVWPNQDGLLGVRARFELLNGKHSDSAVDGPWAWFRLLDRSIVKRVGADRILTSFSAGNVKAKYKIIASSIINPFTLSALHRFRCLKGF